MIGKSGEQATIELPVEHLPMIKQKMRDGDTVTVGIDGMITEWRISELEMKIGSIKVSLYRYIDLPTEREVKL